MAETESKSSRFKSKWGKILKPKEGDAPAAKGNLTFNEDVNAFLQPSIDAAAANKPKLDVSIAQRWPEANEVRLASGEDGDINGWRKRRRREGLKVGFARTAPEVIGEGGDEAPDPVSEVSRNRVRNSRSVSDVRPGSRDQGMDTSRMRGMTVESERPQLAPRAQTSAYEGSPAVQKRQEPPRQQEPPPRLGISRTPTGFASSDEPMTPISPYDDDPPPVPVFPTTIDERFAEPSRSKPMLSAAPQNPDSFAARKQHDMRANEGMAFRRASAMITQGLDLEEAPAEHIVSPMSGLQSAVSPDGPSPFDDPRFNQSRPLPGPRPPEPQSAVSPDSPSPFADPKYVGKHSRESSREMAYQPPQPQQRRQMEQPSYMRAVNQPVSQPSYMNAPHLPPLDQIGSASRVQEHAPGRSGQLHDPSTYMQSGRRTSPERPSDLPIRQPRGSEERMRIPQDGSRSTSRSPMRLRMPDSHGTAQKPFLGDRTNGSSTSVNRYAPSRNESQRSAGSENSPEPYQTATFPSQGPPSPHRAVLGASSTTSTASGYSAQPPTLPQHGRFGIPSPPSPVGPTMNVQSPDPPLRNQLTQNQSPDSPPSSRLGQPGPSPYARGPSPNDYFAAPRQNPTFPATPSRSPAAIIRQEENSRPPSAHSNHSGPRPLPSPQPPPSGNPAADAALADFAGRVAHMKGVFRLTAEKERPAERCTPQDWLRTGLWWYLRGKAGLEALLQQRARSREAEPRELLMQPHVDLAKAWWILSDPLSQYEGPEDPNMHAGRDGRDGQMVRQGCAVTRSHLKSLSYSMARSNLMPPPQSLIQGQDTRIWLDYPRFTPDAAAVLAGAGEQRALIVDDNTPSMAPLDALPLGDTREHHCYSRFLVDTSLNTDEGETDRVSLPSVLTITRGRQDFQSSITIASQSELINLKVSPSQSNTGNLTWHEVSWKASSCAMVLRLARGFDLTIRLQERDFRQVWNIVEYTRKTDHSLRPRQWETLVHEARVAEVQYADSSNPNAFPPDKVKNCIVKVWEKYIEERDGSTVRKMHRGFRLVVVTDPGHKTLSSFGHDVCGSQPLMFEFITDASAHGTTAMVIKVREESRQCRMLLVFPDMENRQNLYDLLNGLDVKEDEVIVGKTNLTRLAIEPALKGDVQANNILSTLQWQKLGITNEQPHDPNSRFSTTVHSENLRLIARHIHGCITDRLNLGKGELLLRFPSVPTPTVQILRQPQEDLTVSVETRAAPPQTPDALASTLHIAQTQPTIRTFTFATPTDLHTFQAAITGFTVRYDGLASTLGISRRRMVVPIYHKWTASNVRIQIVANPQNTVIQLLAFMDDFSHADALCFQIKSTDVYETIKGDAKSKKWAVKMVDAKFSLPPVKEKGEAEGDGWERCKRRFVNLEGLEYQEEHDDITVGFETEDSRNIFAQALPAATTVGRMITLKRRI